MMSNSSHEEIADGDADVEVGKDGMMDGLASCRVVSVFQNVDCTSAEAN